MCVNIEHDIKVNILKEIENDPTNDGYSIVQTFLSTHPEVVRKIARTSKSPFTEDLIAKYFTIAWTYNSSSERNECTVQNYSDCPIWVLFELLSFGDLIYFIDFYKQNYSTQLILTRNVLNLVKSLRNAAAHNNCIISNLKHNTTGVPSEISQRIARITTISTSQRRKKLSCRPMLEFIALLYTYDIIVSKKVKDKTVDELDSLFLQRMIRNKQFFANNQLITTSYEFVTKVIADFFHP